VYRAAKSVNGHLPPFIASTPHSSKTTALMIMAKRNRRNTPTRGNARMLAARNAQMAVCRSLIAVNTRILSQLFYFVAGSLP
jgi:hypothetical protein